MYLKFFFLVHLINALCTWGKCFAESKSNRFYIHIMLFIFQSKERITVNGVFTVLFGCLNIFRSAMKWKTLQTFTSWILLRDCYGWQGPQSLLWSNKTEMQEHMWTCFFLYSISLDINRQHQAHKHKGNVGNITLYI